MLPAKPDILRCCTLPAAVLFLAVLAVAPMHAAGQEPSTQPDQPAAEEEEAAKLPRLDEMVLPSAEELMTRLPQDWIVLVGNDQYVVVCESVSPRPNTIATLQAQIDAKNAERAGKTGDELQRIRDEIDDLSNLDITLVNESENPEYRVELRRIKQIIHHEDLMLRRMNALINEGNLDLAYEMLTQLKRRWDAWPDMEETHDRLLLADGQRRLAGGDPEAALVVLTELHRRKTKVPSIPNELKKVLGDAIDQIVGAALERDDYRMARHFLLMLGRMYSSHDVFTARKTALEAKTNDLLQQAETLGGQGQHAAAAELAQEAADLWPQTPGLMAKYRPLVDRYQQLFVGVVNLATESNSSPDPTPAEVRADHLEHTRLFELTRVRGSSVQYRTRYFSEWEPFDLGRTLRISLRQVRQPWETHPVLDARQLSELIQQKVSRGSPTYDERLAGYVQSVTVESPVSLTLRFRRVPARVEPLLQELIPTGKAADGDDPIVGGFVPETGTADEVVFQRATPEPDGLQQYKQYHVAEVIEIRYASHEKALQALRQGEVWMLPDLPDWIVRRLQADEAFQTEFYIRPYTVPTTHVIQFNPRTPQLRLREMRRALAYAIDRDRLLKEIVLRDPQATNGRVITSPFPSSSPANNVGVQPRKYDLYASIALVLATREQFKRQEREMAPLRMLAPPGPTERQVVDELIRTWARVGLEVQLIESNGEVGDDDWDLQYRTLQMTEPTVELWPFLAARHRAQVSDLDVFPDWMKQELVRLDRTSDWNRALAEMRQIHEVLWADVRCLPLWEVTEHFVVRKKVNGFPDPPLHCYQDVERWSLDPWFATE